MDTITSKEGLTDILTAAPMDIGVEGQSDSGFQRAFDPADCTSALKHTNQYQCGANFFCAKIGSHPGKGVPVMRHGIEQLQKFLYNKADESVGFYPHTITVALDSVDGDVASQFGKLQELSPDELRYAAILSCAADIFTGADQQRVQQWRQLFLTSTVLFIIVPPANRFFKSVTLRNAAMADSEAVARSAFQQMVEIVVFKERLERVTGATLTAAGVAAQYAAESDQADCQETISESLVDMSLSVWRRAMCIPAVLEVVRVSEEKYGTRTVFDSICKMQSILQKSSTPRNIKWCFESIYDLFDHGELPGGVGTRQLQGDRHTKGLPEILIQKLEFLDWVTKKFLPPTPINSAEKDSIVDAVSNGHSHHRQKCGCSCSSSTAVDLTWRAGWSIASDNVLELLEAMPAVCVHVCMCVRVRVIVCLCVRN